MRKMSYWAHASSCVVNNLLSTTSPYQRVNFHKTSKKRGGTTVFLQAMLYLTKVKTSNFFYIVDGACSIYLYLVLRRSVLMKSGHILVTFVYQKMWKYPPDVRVSENCIDTKSKMAGKTGPTQLFLFLDAGTHRCA